MYDKLARFYDLTHAELIADIPYVLQLAATAAGPVLELGCGSGRLLLPLARAGHRVTGVDNAPTMLALARQKLAKETTAVQERVVFQEQDMAALQVTGPFGLAIIPYNTFMHLARPQMGQVLRQVRGVMAPNGRLFIDLTNPLLLAMLPPTLPFALENELVDPATGATIRQYTRQRLDREQQILQVTWRYDEVSPADVLTDSVTVDVDYHYLFPHEIELLLRQTGWRLRQLAGGYGGEPFGEESERLLIMAECHPMRG